jgi:hypothetical protein
MKSSVESLAHIEALRHQPELFRHLFPIHQENRASTAHSIHFLIQSLIPVRKTRMYLETPCILEVYNQPSGED